MLLSLQIEEGGVWYTLARRECAPADEPSVRAQLAVEMDRWTDTRLFDPSARLRIHVGEPEHWAAPAPAKIDAETFPW